MRTDQPDFTDPELSGAVPFTAPYSHRPFSRLPLVANAPRLNTNLGSHFLPASWRTLYELARLDEDQWAVVEPHISPELERGQITKLLAVGSFTSGRSLVFFLGYAATLPAQRKPAPVTPRLPGLTPRP